MVNISNQTNLKKVCLIEKVDRLYVPKTIPRGRESMIGIHFALLNFFVLAHLYVSDDWSVLPGFYVMITVVNFIICFGYRFVLFLYELKHCRSRYENDKGKIVKAAFYFRTRTLIVLFLYILYLVYYVTRHSEFPSLQEKNWFLAIPFLFILHRLLDLENFPINDSLNIAKDDGLDYGSGMAYSFFYGYLNYTLAKAGEPNKNLKEMIIDFESRNNVTFAIYKIFILIPKSLKCFESIQDVSELMEMRSTLPEKRITVAGVRDRIYKNSVYTIRDPKNEKPVYVCVEYATPLKTFKEVFEHNTAHSEFYDRHKNDILLQFYLTLKQVLKQSNMDSMCELVYYEDKDEYDNFHDVGRILLNKIAEINKLENTKEE